MASIRFLDHADTHAARAAAMPVFYRAADRSDPIPPDHRSRFADAAVRATLALMPFTAIAWTFLAH